MLSYYNLDTHPSIETIEYTSEAEWQLLRQEGIGGSDCAAVLGISKYKSPFQVYKEKKGLSHTDLSDNIFIKKGKDLEALIRDQYVAPYLYEKGYVVRRPDVMFVNNKCPWLRANLDGLAVPKDSAGDYTKNIVVEIKWVSEYAESNWFGDDYCGIPANYYAQVQHYMTVVGASKAIVCALFDGTWEVHYFEVPYDIGFATKMLSMTEEFYNKNLGLGIPPRLIPSLDKDEVAVRAACVTNQTPSDEMDVKCATYNALKTQAKELTKQADELHDEIVNMYLEGYKPASRYSMSISTCSRTSVDNKKLQEEYPDAYEACKTTSTYTRTNLRAKKF